uniref:Uncharacterized protein n=1 Tax=Anopheles quadriannulatus TaxID=34691 RepID=A0A182XQK9_ANOQN
MLVHLYIFSPFFMLCGSHNTRKTTSTMVL